LLSDNFSINENDYDDDDDDDGKCLRGNDQGEMSGFPRSLGGSGQRLARLVSAAA